MGTGKREEAHFDRTRSAFVQVYNMGTAYDAWRNTALRMKPSESLVLMPGAGGEGGTALGNLLEKTTLAPIWLIVFVWQTIVFYCMYQSLVTYGGTLVQTGCVFLVALLFGWPLTEYLLHRFVFHFPVWWFNGNGVVNLLQFMAHGIHHKHPRDHMRLFTPLVMSVPVAISILPVFMWLMHPPDASAWMAGFIEGYLVYDTVHWALHTLSVGNIPAWTAPLPSWFSRLRKLHHDHHHAEEGHGRSFGVSTSLWDPVFRTQMPETSAVTAK